MDGMDSRCNGFVWDAVGYQPLISLLFLVLFRPVDGRLSPSAPIVTELGFHALASTGTKAVVMLRESWEFLVVSF
jgi:hypothetical protein